jgi:CBS domain-containing protein
MIKSFQGARTKQTKNLSAESLKVSDFMTTKLVSFKEEDTIFDVITKLLKHNISGGPVLCEDAKLIGVISEGDCLKEVVKGKYLNMPNISGTVKDYMTVNVISIHPDTSIFEAAQKFLELKIRRFPVVKEGKLVGQISQRDIMNAMAQLKSATWEAS